MIENNKTIITLEEGEELVMKGIILEAGDSFEILEAKKDGEGSDSDKDADEKDKEKKDGPGKGKADDSKDEKKKESVVYIVEEDVRIGDIILEKGDRFEVIEAKETDADKKDKEASKGKEAKDSEKDAAAKEKDSEKDKGSKDKDAEKDKEAKDKETEKDADKKKESVYTVEEEVPIPGTDIVLEKGDQFKVL